LTRTCLTTEKGAGHGEPVPAQDQSLVRVLIVDDGQVFGNVLNVMVAATPGFEVVGVASSVREALYLIDALDPQLVLADLHTAELYPTRGTNVRPHSPERSPQYLDRVPLTRAKARG
jgi:DNA-binding NarL/FixJ family response regulator